jgi:hypothetical protein
MQAQEKKVKFQIDKVMQAAREDEMLMPDELIYEKGNVTLTLKYVKPFANDSIAFVRNQAYMIIHKLGRTSENATEVMICVEALSSACHDRDMGIALYSSKVLRSYPRNYFTGKAKKNIGSALFPKSRILPNIAQLAGYLSLQEKMDLLKTIASDSEESLKNRWYANLALARMGYDKSIAYCLNVYQKQKVNSELIEGMIPDLLFTRQKKIYDEVVKILYSNENNCVSGNPDSERAIPCGYWVMEQLAPYVQDFPLQTYASGAIKVTDYDKALNTLREWFNGNVDFCIIDEGF